MKGPAVLSLDDPRCVDQELAGAKAANLARSSGIAAGPIRAGFVLTTHGASLRGDVPEVDDELRAAWERAGGERETFVVRSSSTIEDAGSSSMAGQFTSVLDVRGWEALGEAVDRVIRSADRVRDEHGVRRPIAVLVQAQLDATLGGVMFSADPVTGERSHVAVDVVPSRPDELVGGTVTASHLVLNGSGRVVSRSGPPPPDMSRSLRRRLVRLARETEERFGSPQDIEWAVGADGRLWLLQCRPITAAAAIGEGALLGPGPVAETFPAPLSALEQDLFLPPLRDGIVGALSVTGAVGRTAIERSPVVVAVGGRVAVDLQLIGVTRGKPSLWQRISPVALVRHVGVSWRVGRIRVALPELAAGLIEVVDEHLSSVPRLDEVGLDELVELVDRARRELATVHRYEVLAGMLLHGPPGPPAAAIALGALRRGRRDGLDDDAIVAEHPVVLALRAPAVQDPAPLPPVADAPAAAPDEGPDRSHTVAALAEAAVPDLDDLGPREALRLRARWLQELLARVALELGARLVPGGEDDPPHPVRHLSLAELVAVAQGSAVPTDLAERAAVPPGPPLPPQFRRAPDDTAVAVRPRAGRHGAHRSAGIGAGGGRAVGPALHRAPSGSGGRRGVLVVRYLEPELAPLLPTIDGLVAETGSPLSHLAILAREHGVATVVGVPDALERFPAGTELEVDGATGDVVAVGVTEDS